MKLIRLLKPLGSTKSYFAVIRKFNHSDGYFIMTKKLLSSTFISAMRLILFVPIGSLSATELFSTDFDTDDGDFTEEALGGSPIPSLYNAGRGTWSMEGDDAGPATNYIISPAILVRSSSGVQVSFDHRYSIEAEWDGTALQFSIDGGEFKTVPKSSFTKNGYTFESLIGNHVLGGEAGFNGNSPGYALGEYITSVAKIGGVPGGALLMIRFLGAWDEGAKGEFNPNWEIDSVLVETLDDADGDSMPDIYEDANGLDKTVDDSMDDADLDLVSNLNEFLNGTDPQDADSDGDKLSDGVETGTGIFIDANDRGSNPLSEDSDGDTLPDNVETGDGVYINETMTGTNPNLADTDNDGYTDAQEVVAGTNPSNSASKPDLPLPLGFWPFNDQGEAMTADLSPGENSGELFGGPNYVEGHSGLPGDFAIDFDGFDDAVTTMVSMDGLDGFTMSGWVKAATTSAGRAGLFGQNDVAEFGFIADATVQLWTAPGGAIETTLEPLEWTHLAVVSDATGRRIYVGGVEVSSGGAASPVASSGFTFNIGGGGIYDGSGNFFTGQIDDVAVWDVALGQRTIEELAAGKINPIPLPSGSFGIAEFELTDGNRLNFVIEGTVPSVDYLIEESWDLIEWIEVEDLVGEAGASRTSATYVITDPALSKAFYRVRKLE